MELGIDSFATQVISRDTGVTQSASSRMHDLIEEIVHADAAGLDVFGVGEHHRKEYLDSAPTLILAAAASRTERIRLSSAVTVLSAADPVRVFQQFATLDLISNGRAEIVAGRGSSVEAFPLFGLDLAHYDEIYAEKLDLLLQLRDETYPHWSGRHRASLSGQGVFPRPHQERLPIWLGTGGSTESFRRAGRLGLPLMIAIIGGDFRRFRPLIDLYRNAGSRSGFTPEELRVGVHAFGFVGDTATQARDVFYPGYAHMIATLGRERGWPPPNRNQFDDDCMPHGPYLIGGPREVADKILYVDEVLGGLDRINLQMTNPMVQHDAMLRSITLLGTEAAMLLGHVRPSANRPALTGSPP